jgi:hypothetical protein
VPEEFKNLFSEKGESSTTFPSAGERMRLSPITISLSGSRKEKRKKRVRREKIIVKPERIPLWVRTENKKRIIVKIKLVKIIPKPSLDILFPYYQ